MGLLPAPEESAVIELADLDEIVALRRDIHAHPELAYDEHRTAALVAERLRAWGIETHTGIGRTGVVGVLQAGTGNRAILLRADMDALPTQEANDFELGRAPVRTPVTNAHLVC